MLKSIITVFLLTLFIGLQAQDQSGEVRFVSSPEKGIIVVDANGYGKKKTIAYEDGTKKAFLVLLKNGIPGSSQYLPLLGNNAHQLYQERAAFFTQFFQRQSYLNFLVDQRSGAFSKRARKTDPNVTVRLAINVPAFRRYLEEAGVIRKFGL